MPGKVSHIQQALLANSIWEACSVLVVFAWVTNGPLTTQVHAGHFVVVLRCLGVVLRAGGRRIKYGTVQHTLQSRECAIAGVWKEV